MGDNIIQKPISKFGIEFEKSDAAASILLCEVDNPSRFGIADIINGQISGIGAIKEIELGAYDLANKKYIID